MGWLYVKVLKGNLKTLKTINF